MIEIEYDLIGKIVLCRGHWLTERHKGRVIGVLPGGILCRGTTRKKVSDTFYDWEQINGWDFVDVAVWNELVAEDDERWEKMQARQRGEMTK